MTFTKFDKRKLKWGLVLPTVFVLSITCIFNSFAQIQDKLTRKISFKLVALFEDPGPAKSKALPIIGSLNASGNDKFKKIHLWDDANARFVQMLSGDKDSDFSARVETSADNRIVAVSDNDRYVWIWDVETGKSIHVISVKHNKMAVTPDGITVAVGRFGSGQVTLFDVVSGRQKFILEDSEDEGNKAASPIFSFGPDGNTIAIASYNRILLWEVESGKLVKRIKVPSRYVFSLRYEVKFSPDGKLLACNTNGEAGLWEIETGMPKFMFEHKNKQTNVMEFSLDGKIVATGGNDKTVTLWDVETGKLLRTFKHAKRVLDVKFSSPMLGLMIVQDYRWSAENGYLWDISTGELIDKGNVGRFTKDGHRLMKLILDSAVSHF